MTRPGSPRVAPSLPEGAWALGRLATAWGGSGTILAVRIATVEVREKLTLEEWAALDEDAEGELVDGVLEEEEVASILHEIVVLWFATLLRTWARKTGALALGSEAKIAVGPRRGRKPDVSLFVGARPPLTATLVRIAPHVVVEVVSERPRDARRDRVEKIHDYAAAGVKYYWIVDPQLRTLEILRRDARGRFVHAIATSEGRIDDVPGCEGLTIDLDELWRETAESAPKGRALRPRGVRGGKARRS